MASSVRRPVPFGSLPTCLPEQGDRDDQGIYRGRSKATATSRHGIEPIVAGERRRFNRGEWGGPTEMSDATPVPERTTRISPAHR